MLIGCQAPQRGPLYYCNPAIGTSYTGHTFIGASYPFGLIQPGPDSGNNGWGYCSGYRFEDKAFMGFSQTHLSGTGVAEMGDLLIMPFTGDISSETNYYEATVKKETERYFPGYYGIELEKFPVKVEITCAAHTSLYKLSYTKEEEAKLMVDFQACLNRGVYERVAEHEIYFPDEYTVCGRTRKAGWRTGDYGFIIKFSRPYTRHEALALRKNEKAQEKAGREVFEFGKLEEPLLVKIALSSVDEKGAKKNLEAEIPNWDFLDTLKKCQDEWNKYLKRAYIVEGSGAQKTNFYTSIYHLCLQPNNLADVDGRYKGCDRKIHTAKSGRFFSTFSTWDTFRAAHPLYTLIAPELVADFVNSMLEQQKIKGYLPIWALWGDDNQCMIGTHSVPIIVDAWLKGFSGFEEKTAWEAIRNTLREKHQDRWRENWDLLETYGYYPYDLTEESASRTLECAYDDWCALKMAEKLGTKDDIEYFKKRCETWRNVIDRENGLARAKNSKGEWQEPFDPFEVGKDFTEASAWQYTWHVMQNPEALIELLGGKERALTQLEKLFAMPSREGRLLDVTGLIGEYGHGNEPSHHVAYFFQFLGKPRRTAEIVREVFDRFYFPKPDGLCGNDDCGQMSAWYIFSALGFYPFNPCGGDYVLGAPQIPKVCLNLPNGRRFYIEAVGLSEKKKYVKEVFLNGEPLTGFILKHSDIMKGGNLRFVMTE